MEHKIKWMGLTLELSSLWKRNVSPYGKMEVELSSFESFGGITEWQWKRWIRWESAKINIKALFNYFIAISQPKDYSTSDQNDIPNSYFPSQLFPQS